MVVDEVELREAVLPAVPEAGGDAAVAVVGAEQLKDRQQRGRAPLVDAVPLRAVLPVLADAGAGRVDRQHLADAPALDQQQQTRVGRGVGGLDRLHQNQLLLPGEGHQLLALGAAERQRGLAQNVPARLERAAELGSMLFRPGAQIDRVHPLEQAVEVVGDELELPPPAFGQGLAAGVQGADVQAVDKGALPPELRDEARVARETQSHRTAALADLGAGHALGPREIDDLAVGVEIVELADPVGADRENVDIVFADVVDLLALVLLDDDLVRQARGAHRLDALHQGLAHVDLAALLVEIVRGDADDQPVAQRLRALEQADVTVVQQIIGAVGDDLYHGAALPFRVRADPCCSCRAGRPAASADPPGGCARCGRCGKPRP